MPEGINLLNELNKTRKTTRKEEDVLMDEVKSILNADLLKENKILNHLKFYNKAFELIDESEVDRQLVFSLEDIRKVCINNRLRFLDSQTYKQEIPYEAILKIKDLNTLYRKDLKSFKILAPAEAFKDKRNTLPCLLFVPTLNENYYLVHSWGQNLKWYRKFKYFPLRSIETMFLSLALFTLIVDISLPVELITLDRSAPYWCGYRVATYFHLLIFFSGFTTYATFAFHRNFSGSDWKNPRV